MEIEFLKKCVWNFRNHEKKRVGNDVISIDSLIHFHKGEIQTDLPEKEVKQMVAAGYAKIKGQIEQTPANVQEKETKVIVHKTKEKPKK